MHSVIIKHDLALSKLELRFGIEKKNTEWASNKVMLNFKMESPDPTCFLFPK